MERSYNNTAYSEEQRRRISDAYHAGLYKHGTPDQDLIWKLTNTVRYAGQESACGGSGKRRI